MENKVEEVKKQIINLFINERKRLNIIAKKMNMPMNLVWNVINEYCEKNDYETIIRGQKGVIITKSKPIYKTRKILEYMPEMLEWIEKNKRIPLIRKDVIGPIKTGEEIKNETKEERERRLARTWKYIEKNIINKYEGMDLEDILNEEDKKILLKVTEVKNKILNSNNKDSRDNDEERY